jgi:methylaspartate ammonia-lyase
LRILAARHAPDQLIDDAVKAPIVVERLAWLAGDGDQRAARIEALILERAEVIPAADLDGARKPALPIER